MLENIWATTFKRITRRPRVWSPLFWTLLADKYLNSFTYKIFETAFTDGFSFVFSADTIRMLESIVSETVNKFSSVCQNFGLKLSVEKTVIVQLEKDLLMCLPKIWLDEYKKLFDLS